MLYKSWFALKPKFLCISWRAIDTKLHEDCTVAEAIMITIMIITTNHHHEGCSMAVRHRRMPDRMTKDEVEKENEMKHRPRHDDDQEEKVKMHPIKLVRCSAVCGVGRMGSEKAFKWLFNQIRITLDFDQTPIQENFGNSWIWWASIMTLMSLYLQHEIHIQKTLFAFSIIF